MLKIGKHEKTLVNVGQMHESTMVSIQGNIVKQV